MKGRLTENCSERFEPLLACNFFPLIYIFHLEGKSFLCYNENDKRLSDKPIRSFMIEEFEGDLGSLEGIVGKDKICLSKPDEDNENDEKRLYVVYVEYE